MKQSGAKTLSGTGLISLTSNRSLPAKQLVFWMIVSITAKNDF